MSQYFLAYFRLIFYSVQNLTLIEIHFFTVEHKHLYLKFNFPVGINHYFILTTKVT